MQSLRVVALGLIVGACVGFGGIAWASASLDEPKAASQAGGSGPGAGLSMMTVYREPTTGERQLAMSSIEGQLQAFRSGDYVRAVDFQASALRGQLGSPQAFRRMMQRSYPQFARYRSISFLEARCNDSGERFQFRVMVTGEDDVTVGALYVLVREDGQYRISEVRGGQPQRTNTRNII